ncbi:hypothetical protein DFJ77DRAFT_298225 [Powellomyces hirtus]|nr:hypothetical protein DFJ77DRAFT_298225 [Powellomyces hirtus]
MDPSSQGGAGPSNHGETDPALLDAFKTAAQTVTQLYRESIKQQRRGFQAGYDQCLQDLWHFVAAQRGQGRENLVLTDLISYFAAKHEANRTADFLPMQQTEPDSAPQSQHHQEQQPQQHQQQRPTESIPHSASPQSVQTGQQPSQRHTQQQQSPAPGFPQRLPSSDFSFIAPEIPPNEGYHYQQQHQQHHHQQQQSQSQQQQQRQPGQRSIGLVPPHLAPSMQGVAPAAQQQSSTNLYQGVIGAGEGFDQQQHAPQLESSSPMKRRWNAINATSTFNWSDPFALEPAYKRSRWRQDEKQDRNDMSD